MNDNTTPTTTSTTDELVQPAPRRRRRLLLIAGIAAAGLGVVALTSGVTLAIADEWHDDDARTELVADRDEADAPGASSQADDDVTAASADFTGALAAALAAADGVGAESIEAERDGWSVDVVRADGTEVDVRLAADGTATLGDEDRADGTTSLDDAALRSAIGAALDASEGDVHSVSVTDDAGAAYEVTVVAGGVERDILLDGSFAVVGTDG